MADEKDYPDSLIDYYDMDVDYPYGDTEWVSECCGAYPIGALQQTEEDMAFGVCGHCKEHTSFDIG